MSTESVNKSRRAAKICLMAGGTLLLIGFLISLFTATHLASNAVYDIYHHNGLQCTDIEFKRNLALVHLRVIDTTTNPYVPGPNAFTKFKEQHIDFSRVFLFAGNEQKGLLAVETQFESPGHVFERGTNNSVEDEIILKFDSVVADPRLINTFRLQFLDFPEVRIQPIETHIKPPGWITTLAILFLSIGGMIILVSFFQSNATARGHAKDVLKYGAQLVAENVNKSDSPIKFPQPSSSSAAPEDKKKAKDERRFERYRSKRYLDLQSNIFESLEAATEDDILTYKAFNQLKRRILEDPELDEAEQKELIARLEKRQNQRSNDNVSSIFEGHK